MSLILPDEELKKLATSELWTACSCSGCEKDRERFRAIARAQARHMAGEIVAKMEPHKTAINSMLKHKYGETAAFCLGRLDAFSDVEAWLRQEGVM